MFGNNTMDSFLCELSLRSLSPCSLCDTIIDLNHADYGRDELAQSAESAAPERAAGPTLKILLPNLVDHVSVPQTELEAFVAEFSSADVSVTHLLIYLFAKKVHPLIRHINNVKLLHVGKLYWVGKTLDLSVCTPLIRDVIDVFPTFQLIIAAEFLGPPFAMPIDRMIIQSDSPMATPAATYAEAMVRRFRSRRRSYRKPSVETMDFRATRFLLRGSATDTEESSASVTTLKIKRSFKKLIRKTRELSISSTPHQYDICI